MGWKVFDCMAAAALFAVLCGVLYVVLTGLQTGRVMVELHDRSIIFIVAAIAAVFLVAGLILLIRLFRRLGRWD